MAETAAAPKNLRQRILDAVTNVGNLVPTRSFFFSR